MSIETTEYGTYRVRWRDAHGKQRARTFKTQLLAKQHERAVFTDLRRGDYVGAEAGKITVREWADLWLDGAHNLKQGGIDSYRRDLEAYILPELGRTKIGSLTPAMIDRYLKDREDAGLASSTRRRHYATIRRMCQVAVERNLLAKNPCDKVEPPHVADTEMRFLTVEEVDALADAISDRYRAPSVRRSAMRCTPRTVRPTNCVVHRITVRRTTQLQRCSSTHSLVRGKFGAYSCEVLQYAGIRSTLDFCDRHPRSAASAPFAQSQARSRGMRQGARAGQPLKVGRCRRARHQPPVPLRHRGRATWCPPRAHRPHGRSLRRSEALDRRGRGGVMGRLLDVHGCAEYLGFTESKVRGLVERGQIPFMKLGKKLHFDVRTLDRWIERSMSEAS